MNDVSDIHTQVDSYLYITFIIYNMKKNKIEAP